MKFATVVAVDGGGDNVDSLMSCWGNDGDQHYAVVDSSGEVALSSSSDELKLLDPVVVDSANKSTMDVLDSLLSGPVGGQNGGNGSFAELKPLPPFITSYTGQVRLNDIRLNEFYSPSQQIPSPGGGVGSSVQTRGGGGLLESNNNNSNVTNNNNNTLNNNNNNVYKNCSVSTSAGELYYMSEPVTSTVDGLVTKPEDVLIGNIESEMDDFAAIIGNVMADTTVHTAGLEVVDTRDAWMDFDLIDTDCTSGNKTISVADAEYLHEMANHFADCSPPPPQAQATPPTSSQNLSGLNSSSTLQSLLTQGPNSQHYQGQMIKREPATYHHMPLLQSRLQNGGSPQHNGNLVPKQENSAYSQYTACGTLSKDMLPHTTLASPPGHVTTSDIPTAINGGGGGNSGRFGQNGRNKSYSRPGNNRDLNGSCSSLDGFPPPKISKSKSRSNKNKLSNSNNNNSNSNNNSISTYPDGSTKEKPVHHCTICNRGFLNKSNIKVHLRTHTGEKPFRCDTCGKAFRQKAHLIKHQQIHKRVGRD